MSSIILPIAFLVLCLGGIRNAMRNESHSYATAIHKVTHPSSSSSSPNPPHHHHHFAHHKHRTTTQPYPHHTVIADHIGIHGPASNHGIKHTRVDVTPDEDVDYLHQIQKGIEKIPYETQEFFDNLGYRANEYLQDRYKGFRQSIEDSNKKGWNRFGGKNPNHDPFDDFFSEGGEAAPAAYAKANHVRISF